MLLQANAPAYRVQTSLKRRSLKLFLRYDMSAKFPREGVGNMTFFSLKYITCNSNIHAHIAARAHTNANTPILGQ